MKRDEKGVVIEEIAAQLQEAEAVFAVDYRGITVTEVSDLRTQLRGADTSFRVVKNTLTQRAAAQAGIEGLDAVLEGPTAFAFVRGDSAAAAKTLADFGRRTSLVPFKGGVLGGQAVSVEQIQAIARLPARDVLIGQFVGAVASPLSGLARTLNALVGGLAVALGQIAEQGLVGGAGAPAAASGEADTPPAPSAEQADVVEADEVPEQPGGDREPEVPAPETAPETTSPDEAPGPPPAAS